MQSGLQWCDVFYEGVSFITNNRPGYRSLPIIYRDVCYVCCVACASFMLPAECVVMWDIRPLCSLGQWAPVYLHATYLLSTYWHTYNLYFKYYHTTYKQSINWHNYIPTDILTYLLTYLHTKILKHYLTNAQF